MIHFRAHICAFLFASFAVVQPLYAANHIATAQSYDTQAYIASGEIDAAKTTHTSLDEDRSANLKWMLGLLIATLGTGNRWYANQSEHSRNMHTISRLKYELTQLSKNKVQRTLLSAEEITAKRTQLEEELSLVEAQQGDLEKRRMLWGCATIILGLITLYKGKSWYFLRSLVDKLGTKIVDSEKKIEKDAAAAEARAKAEAEAKAAAEDPAAADADGLPELREDVVKLAQIVKALKKQVEELHTRQPQQPPVTVYVQGAPAPRPPFMMPGPPYPRPSR